MEIWKDIPGYENMYQASNAGQIRSLDRLNSAGTFVRGKVLKQHKNDRGYKMSFLYGKHKRKSVSTHRLVASTFVPNPSNLPEVNHIDKNKDNNSANNLEWMTTRGNVVHSKRGSGSSKYPGVCWVKARGKWISGCYFKKKRHHLGYFDNEKEAAQAYIDFCKNNNLK